MTGRIVKYKPVYKCDVMHHYVQAYAVCYVTLNSYWDVTTTARM